MFVLKSVSFEFRFCLQLIQCTYTVKLTLNKTSREPTQSGLNSELVLIVRTKYNEISCLRPIIGGLNRQTVSILSGLNSGSLLYSLSITPMYHLNSSLFESIELSGTLLGPLLAIIISMLQMSLSITSSGCIIRSMSSKTFVLKVKKPNQVSDIDLFYRVIKMASVYRNT